MPATVTETMREIGREVGALMDRRWTATVNDEIWMKPTQSSRCKGVRACGWMGGWVSSMCVCWCQAELRSEPASTHTHTRRQTHTKTRTHTDTLSFWCSRPEPSVPFWTCALDQPKTTQNSTWRPLSPSRAQSCTSPFLGHHSSVSVVVPACKIAHRHPRQYSFSL